ncbi:MAG: MoxR family ATPase [Chloroflexi bacterium]|nr:MoxR family ATPase [Chloroflexota bacterium]
MEKGLVTAQLVAERIVNNVERVILGKPQVVELAVIALVSGGHLLIEDAPGVGKTMLARSLAKSVNCSFKRIQFTPDMLPGDLTGVSIYNQKTSDFEYRPGPIMAQIILADEINRATPKVQSALLECMEERQATVDGTTHAMPAPFHVLATENPLEYEGTFPLPETQLDRFVMRINLGYPSLSDEMLIMERQQFSHPIEQLTAVASAADLLMLQEAARKVYVDSLIREYIASLAQATRQHPAIYLGCSPRGSLALFHTAQARALVRGYDFVTPDDVKAVAEPVLSHRLILHPTNGSRNRGSKSVIAELLETVRVPGAMA